MSSLMNGVLRQITPGGSQLTEEELLASFDLDATEISLVEGGWEPVNVGDPAIPHHTDLNDNDFEEEGPSVYERNGFVIVRGVRDGVFVWFAFEPATVGVH